MWIWDWARIYNREDTGDNYTLYTLGETEINRALLSDKSKLPILSPDRTGDFDIKMIEGLMEKWQEPFATLSPNTLTFNNFTGYYTQFTGSIASKGNEYRTLADNQQAMAGSIQEKRSGVTGVSSVQRICKIYQRYRRDAGARNRKTRIRGCDGCLIHFSD